MYGSQDVYGFTFMRTIKVLPALHVTSLFPQQVTDYNMAKSLQSFAQNGPTHQVINSSLMTVIFFITALQLHVIKCYTNFIIAQTIMSCR